jgi:hypothetical protein
MAAPQILSAQSFAKDAQTAVKEFHAGVYQEDMALVIFFCSSHYDRDKIANEMSRLFPNILVVGCTTAGEIGPGGYRDHSLSGASFPAKHFTAVAGYHDYLQQFDMSQGHTFVNHLLQQLEARAPATNHHNTFAFMLIDGLSRREEPVVRTFQKALGDIALFGGSAGDDLQFKKTWVFCDGAFHEDSVVLVLANTTNPFKIFKSQHFVSTTEKLVVTKADPIQRIVMEINGLPAAQEYARVAKTDVDKLDPTRFSASPMVVRINGVDYVRSIQKVNADDSLTFYCAIDSGLVFMAAHGVNLVQNLQETFNNLESEIGKPQLVLACDCILRNLETIREGSKKTVEDIFKKNHVIGFSTYGEQFMGVHINQTITGLAIGSPQDKTT